MHTTPLLLLSLLFPKASDHAEALEWYNYSLSFFPAREEKDKNVAKLQVKASQPPLILWSL